MRDILFDIQRSANRLLRAYRLKPTVDSVTWHLPDTILVEVYCPRNIEVATIERAVSDVRRITHAVINAFDSEYKGTKFDVVAHHRPP